jgi:DNA modification methylase
MKAEDVTDTLELALTASGRQNAQVPRAASANMLAVTKGANYICMSSSELDTLQKAFREAGGKWSTFVI